MRAFFFIIRGPKWGSTDIWHAEQNEGRGDVSLQKG